MFLCLKGYSIFHVSECRKITLYKFYWPEGVSSPLSRHICAINLKDQLQNVNPHLSCFSGSKNHSIFCPAQPWGCVKPSIPGASLSSSSQSTSKDQKIRLSDVCLSGSKDLSIFCPARPWGGIKSTGPGSFLSSLSSSYETQYQNDEFAHICFSRLKICQYSMFLWLKIAEANCNVSLCWEMTLYETYLPARDSFFSLFFLYNLWSSWRD